MSATVVQEDRHAACYDVISRRDPAYNGRFFTGVLTTGIYCLPSCAARTPKIENVRFFDTAADAERFGLRPCRRCRPDRLHLFEEETALRAVVERFRNMPWQIRGIQDLANAMDCGISKLNALCHAHYHSTPAHLIARGRNGASPPRRRCWISRHGLRV
jgi:AraC family transcriptional regulator of adaptative response / DNA-3-methyladenine glycosylase II